MLFGRQRYIELEDGRKIPRAQFERVVRALEQYHKWDKKMGIGPKEIDMLALILQRGKVDQYTRDRAFTALWLASERALAKEVLAKMKSMESTLPALTRLTRIEREEIVADVLGELKVIIFETVAIPESARQKPTDGKRGPRGTNFSIDKTHSVLGVLRNTTKLYAPRLINKIVGAKKRVLDNGATVRTEYAPTFSEIKPDLGSGNSSDSEDSSWGDWFEYHVAESHGYAQDVSDQIIARERIFTALAEKSRKKRKVRSAKGARRAVA